MFIRSLKYGRPSRRISTVFPVFLKSVGDLDEEPREEQANMFRISACISLAVDIFLFCWYIWLIENGKIAYQFHFTIPVLVLIGKNK